MPRVFLLSPANCGGRRAQQVLSPRATFLLASELRRRRGAALGDVFAFVSGLYFRGKLTYARRFAAPPEPDHPVVGSAACTSSRRTPACAAPTRSSTRERLPRVRRRPTCTWTTLPIAVRSSRAPGRWRCELGPDCDVVLLGSIASPKYVDVLLDDLRRLA